ncbi:MAG: amino acid synthesis family protein [Candidatus Tectomicrobia bacterium]|nr:amino acid synthesis family protein [Candidatus Tectomicrobia bacterium]
MKPRKFVTFVEEIHEDRGVALPRPLRIAIAAAVVPDPLAGKFVDNLNEIVLTYCEQLSDIEHAAAILANYRFAGAVEAATNGASHLPSVIKVAPPGAPFDIPLHHKIDVTSRPHHFSKTFSIADAPRAEELVVAVAVANGGRPHPRLPAFGQDLK